MLFFMTEFFIIFNVINIIISMTGKCIAQRIESPCRLPHYSLEIDLINNLLINRVR